MRPSYSWRVHYVSGSFADESEMGSFADVVKDACTTIELIPHRWNRKPIKVQIDLDEGQRAVFFRRHFQTVHMDGTPDKHWIVHCVGYEVEDQKNLLYVSNDGSILLTSDFNAV